MPTSPNSKPGAGQPYLPPERIRTISPGSTTGQKGFPGLFVLVFLKGRDKLSLAQTQLTTVRAEAERTSQRLHASAGELADAQVKIEQFREQLATLRQEATDLMAARVELAERLVAENERTEHQRHRAETAEQRASRASGQLDYLSRELTTLRDQLEHWQSQAAEQRAELAGLRSELTAARAAIETEKAHSAQRLADQHTRHEETIGELRAQLGVSLRKLSPAAIGGISPGQRPAGAARWYSRR